MKQRFILSTIGITIFLKVLSPEEQEWQSKLNRLSNEKELPPDASEKLAELKERAIERLKSDTTPNRRLLSPELNGLYGIYENKLISNSDQHYLIGTDTVLGKTAAEVLLGFLRNQGLNVNHYTPRGLNTKTPISFSQGMKEMLKWCEDTIPGYRDSQYEVIFNLTAAFKSLQGYLNIVGMFYADRMVYIFEGSERLMSIPRLPIHIDTGKISTNAEKMALLAAGALLSRQEAAAVPEGLLDEDEKGDVTISDWGILVWNRIKKEILTQRLLSFPGLLYEPSFHKDYDRATHQQRIDLQETLAEVSSILLSSDNNVNKLKSHGGLQYDNYTNKQTKKGQPIGHFRVTLNNRISCVSSGEALHLRHFGVHDYVNNNP